MEAYIPFQELVTVRLGAAGGEVLQSREGYLDLAEHDSVFVRVEVFSLTTGATLALDTAVSDDGPFVESKVWTQIPSGANAIDEVVHLATYDDADFPLGRLLRWKFEASGAATATFRLSYRVAKGAA